VLPGSPVEGDIVKDRIRAIATLVALAVVALAVEAARRW
jgi:hypothetical protein